MLIEFSRREDKLFIVVLEFNAELPVIGKKKLSTDHDREFTFDNGHSNIVVHDFK